MSEMRKYPTPQIGYYYAQCCLLDLYRIDTEEDLAAVFETIEDNDEDGIDTPIFATLAEAIAHCDGPFIPDDERKEHYARLGWVPLA